MPRHLLPLALFSCLTLLPGCAMPGEEDDDDEAGEVKIALADAPDAVQATLKKEAGAGRINEVEVVTNGKTEDITIAEDGTFLGREAEAADEDDDDGEDDD